MESVTSAVLATANTDEAGRSYISTVKFVGPENSTFEINCAEKTLKSDRPLELVQDGTQMLIKIPKNHNKVKVNIYSSPSVDQASVYLIASVEKTMKAQKYRLENIENGTTGTIEFSLEPQDVGNLSLQLIENQKPVSKLTVRIVEHTVAPTSSNVATTLTPRSDSIPFGNPESAASKTQFSTNPFPIPMEDGPVFRETLNDYETKITKLKQAIKATNDALSSYESLSKQFMKSKNSLVTSLMNTESLFPSFYGCSFDSSMITAFQNVSDENGTAIKKIKSKMSTANSLSGIDFTLSARKRAFEEESKKYYDWLSKLLSSGKSKDEKFLSKRKSFELAKIEYFTFLIDTLAIIVHDFSNHNNQFDGVYNRSKKQRQLIKNAIERSSSMTQLNNELSKLEESHLSSSKSGLLFTQGGQGKSGWHKQWVVLKNGKLSEYMDWRKGTSRRNDPIDISLCSIKPLDSVDKRKGCFRIITSTGMEHLFQAISEEDRDLWIQALYDAGQLIKFRKDPSAQSQPSNTSAKNGIKSDTKENHHKNAPNYGGVVTPSKGQPFATRSFQDDNNLQDGTNRARRVSSVTLDNLRLVQRVDSSNERCCDCGSSDSVEWISINLLVIFCVKCSSCHRSLGTSVSKVRSLKLDSFTEETERLLSHVNNKTGNSIYEELLTKEKQISPNASDEERLKFITKKYAKKTFVNKTLDGDASTLLIHGIKHHNTTEVLRSFALDVDKNLKLSKTLPSGKIEFGILEYALKYPSYEGEPENSKRIFEFAELLLLNGVTCGDVVENTLGLSKEALSYWQSRIDRLKGSVNSNLTSASKLTSVHVPEHAIYKTPTSISGVRVTTKEHKFHLLKKKK